MQVELKFYLILAAAAFFLAVLWAASFAYTYWDVRRRNLSSLEGLAWVALVAVLPLIGFFAYLFARLLVAFFSPRIPGVENNRMTALKAAPQASLESAPGRATGTLVASDLINDTRLEAPAPIGGIKKGQAGAASFELIVVEGPSKGARYSIDRLPVRIGRGSTVEIRLDEDLTVSRNHAEIQMQNGVLWILDQHSSHGTQVNGEVKDTSPLKPGDRIRAGQSELLLSVREGGQTRERWG